MKLLVATILISLSSISFAGYDCFIGEVNYFPYNFAPKGFAEANGAPLPIVQNEALFSLLGIKFGGNGTTTFNLPKISPIKTADGGEIKAYICTNGTYPERP